MNAKETYETLMKYYPQTLEELKVEEWRDVEGYEGFYQVSNFGRVKRIKCIRPHILKPTLISGYCYVDLSKQNQTKQHRIHRLVAKAFIPNPNCKPEINHIDGHKLNNHVANLEWATGVENMEHAVKLGLQKSGADVYNAGLTLEQANEILSSYVAGSQQFGSKALAKKFGVTYRQILRVVHGRTYKKASGTRQPPKPRKPAIFLTEEQKNVIRSKYVKGSIEFGATALAKIYNVHPDTIRVIVGAKRR